jgi:hypothetical protein
MALQFVATEYMATGEGSTICILITKAYPSHDDYKESNSHTNPDGSFHFEMPELKDDWNPGKKAMQEFVAEFGTYYALGAQLLTKEEFLRRFYNHLPAWMPSLIDKDDAGNLYYASRFHINFS